ncbi:MAG: pirin family protein [Abyssibacter sp.]|uniref:pirin family protein n=1 Tax=Abyssibacter sp. TaxID=2320200 RepID=UPI00321AD0FA
MELRPGILRGQSNTGWLDSRHSFSFAGYYDPARMGLSDLRVLNDDRVAGGGGFPPHVHHDMEILTYVLEGQLVHRDSTGRQSLLEPGDLQVMSAGTGIEHSEMNASAEHRLRFLQIWILPEHMHLPPAHACLRPDADPLRQSFQPVAGPAGAGFALTLHQQASLYLAWPDAAAVMPLPRDPARPLRYLHVAEGSVCVAGQRLMSGDAAILAAEEEATLIADVASQVLLFGLRSTDPMP